MKSVSVDDSLNFPVAELEAKMLGKRTPPEVYVEDTTPAPPPPQVKDLDRSSPSIQDRGSQIK